MFNTRTTWRHNTWQRTASRACLALFALPLLAGCGDDGPAPRAAQDDPSITRRTAYAPLPRRALPPTLVPASAPVPDPLEAPDGLLGASNTPDTPAPPSPLSGPAPPPAPSTDTNDPLVSDNDPLISRTPGQKMPTEHSHWLRGIIFNARVAVRLNGLYLGTYTAPQDRDITMRLRNGINTITLAYTPLAPTAAAHLDVLESEHTPPIAPLATFRSPTADAASSRALSQTTTQTLTFLAR